MGIANDSGESGPPLHVASLLWAQSVSIAVSVLCTESSFFTSSSLRNVYVVRKSSSVDSKAPIFVGVKGNRASRFARTCALFFGVMSHW